MCEISDNVAKCGESSGLFYDSVLSTIFIYKAWTHKFMAVGWGQWNHTHSLDRPSFSLSRQLYVGYRNMPCQTRNTCPRIERNAKQIRSSLRGGFQRRVCLRHIICEFWRWSPSVMKFSWAGTSLETPAGTPRANDKTGLARRDARNKISTVKISREKR